MILISGLNRAQTGWWIKILLGSSLESLVCVGLTIFSAYTILRDEKAVGRQCLVWNNTSHFKEVIRESFQREQQRSSWVSNMQSQRSPLRQTGHHLCGQAKFEFFFQATQMQLWFYVREHVHYGLEDDQVEHRFRDTRSGAQCTYRSVNFMCRIRIFLDISIFKHRVSHNRSLGFLQWWSTCIMEDDLVEHRTREVSSGAQSTNQLISVTLFTFCTVAQNCASGVHNSQNYEPAESVVTAAKIWEMKKKKNYAKRIKVIVENEKVSVQWAQTAVRMSSWRRMQNHTKLIGSVFQVFIPGINLKQ